MPNIELRYNSYLSSYTGKGLHFSHPGSVLEVSESQAQYLLSEFAGLFELAREDTILLPSDGEVEIEFINNRFLKEYHSREVSFMGWGERKHLPVSLVRRLLNDHSDKFRVYIDALTTERLMDEEIVVQEQEQEQEPLTRYAEPILSVLRKSDKPLKLSDIASELGINWRTLPFPISKLLKSNLIGSVPDINGKNTYFVSESE